MNTSWQYTRLLAHITLLCIVVTISACGGGSGSGAATQTPGTTRQGSGPASAAVSIAKVSPNTEIQGVTNVHLTLYGSGLNASGLSISISPSGSCLEGTAAPDGTSLTITCTMPSSGESATVTATLAGQQSSAVITLLAPPLPTFSNWTQGNAVNVNAASGPFTNTVSIVTPIGCDGAISYSISPASGVATIDATSGQVTPLTTVTTTQSATVTATSAAVPGICASGSTTSSITVAAPPVITAIKLGLMQFSVPLSDAGTSINVVHAPRMIQNSITALPTTIVVPQGEAVTPGPSVTLDYNSPQTFTVESGNYSSTYTVTIVPYNATSNPYGIYSAEDLDDIRNYLAASYELESNITLPETNISGANSSCTEPFPSENDYCTNGWLPIGNDNTGFSGTFSGAGHIISGLEINRPNSSNGDIGLFGDVSGVIQDVGVITGPAGVSGAYSGQANAAVGVLVGGLSAGTIRASFAQGTVSAVEYVGGLAGYQGYGTIKECFANIQVTSNSYFAGGLVGYSISGVVTDSYAQGAVSALALDAGGLIGSLNGFLSESYANGTVLAPSRVGGLATDTTVSTVGDSYYPIGQPDNGVGTVVATGASVNTFVGFTGSGFPTTTPDIWTWVNGYWPELSVPDSSWTGTVWMGAQTEVALP